MQLRVEAGELKQSRDDGLGTGDEELAPLSGQLLVCPDEYRKTAAVHEAERGEIHDEETPRVFEGAADGKAQLVPGAYVELAPQPQQGARTAVVDGDSQAGGSRHQMLFP
jgi:hypothetical protein